MLTIGNIGYFGQAIELFPNTDWSRYGFIPFPFHVCVWIQCLSGCRGRYTAAWRNANVWIIIIILFKIQENLLNPTGYRPRGVPPHIQGELLFHQML